jgi:molecular chaperone GrpE
MSKKKKVKEEMDKEATETLNNNGQDTPANSAEEKETANPAGDDATAEKQNTPVTAEEKCSELSAKIEELNAKYLYLFAEFDNYRKRTQKERIELIKSASADVITQLLPVLDNFDRAAKSFETATDLEAIKEGVILIQNQFRNILMQKGLEEINAVGEVFNTDLHEAIANVPADCDENKGRVMEMVEKGYFLNGKVLRFAKVLVAN